VLCLHGNGTNIELGPKVLEFEKKCVEIEIIGFLIEKNQTQTQTQRIFNF
jgi:hypothetical protein